MSWPKVALPDAFWFQEGPGLRNWQFTTEGIKVLNVGNIMPDGSIDLSRTDRHVSLEEFNRKYSHFGVDEGDLVIASSGISFDEDGFLRTKVGFIESEHLPLCMNTSTIRFKAVEGKSDLRFLKHWFQSVDFRRQVSQRVTGTAQLNFGPSHLKTMTIELPPLEEQKRIAAILDKTDELRRLRQRGIDRLNSLGQAIFHEMFGDTANAQRVPLGDVIDVRSSLADPKLPEYRDLPHVGPEHISSGSGRISWERVVSCQEDCVNSGKYVFEEGDVIYSKIRPYLDKVAMVDRKGMCSADMYALSCKLEHCLPSFIHFALGTSDFLSYAALSSGRANIPKINRKQLLGYPIPLPTLEEQKKFENKIQRLEESRCVAERHLNRTESLFASLQSRAFRGEL